MHNETVHRYSRSFTWIIEILCALSVALSVTGLGVIILRLLWDLYGLTEPTLLGLPLPIQQIILWLNGPIDHTPSVFTNDVTGPLIGTLIAFSLAMWLRNALPMIRTSPRGILVEFASNWIALPWDKIRMMKVTADAKAERYVVLVQVDPSALTSWHHLFSLLYGLQWKRAFLVTSSISEFDRLVQTMLSETDRAARASENAVAPEFQEEASSPFFRLLLNPLTLGRQAPTTETSSTTPVEAPAEPSAALEAVSASYHAPFSLILGALSTIVIALGGWHYLLSMARFIALLVPAVRGIVPFSWSLNTADYVALVTLYATSGVPFMGVPNRFDLPAPWWILLSAHLAFLIFGGMFIFLRHLFPAIETRPDSLAFRGGFGRWHTIPWEQIRTLKSAEFSEQRQVVLVQTRGKEIPWYYTFNSRCFDGSSEPGVLIASPIKNFQPLLQSILLKLMLIGRQINNPTEVPKIIQDLHPWLIWLPIQAGAAIDRLVELVREDSDTKDLQQAKLLRIAPLMSVIAFPPALLILITDFFLDGTPPSIKGVLIAVIFWVLGMLEWPLMCLIAKRLDDATGGGDEGQRAFYTYPYVLIPRLIPLAGALICALGGIPILPGIFWLVGIGWSGLLVAGLWDALFQWRGNQALLGGLIPAIWQLFLLLGFLFIK